MFYEVHGLVTRTIFNSLLVLVLLSCTSKCGKIKIIDAPFSFNNAAGAPQHRGEAGSNRLVARVKPQRPAGPQYLIDNLYGKCFFLQSGSYKYELCPFHNVTQQEHSHRWNAFHGVLGIWKEWTIVNDTFDSMLMVHGDVCAGTLDRQTKVKLKCGDVSKIIAVKEPSMCRYEMNFETPYACPSDVFLVYPLLSTYGKKTWRTIEERFAAGEITLKGYQKRRNILFENEGLKAVSTQDTSVREEGKNTEMSKPDSAGHLSAQHKQPEGTSYMDLMHRFATKAQCVEEYRKLSQENGRLRLQVVDLLETFNETENSAKRSPKTNQSNESIATRTLETTQNTQNNNFTKS